MPLSTPPLVSITDCITSAPESSSWLTPLKEWAGVFQSFVTSSAMLIGLFWAIPKFEQNYRKVNYEKRIHVYTDLIQKWAEFKKTVERLHHVSHLEKRCDVEAREAEESFKEMEARPLLHPDSVRKYEYRKTLWQALLNYKFELQKDVEGLRFQFTALHSDFLGLLGQIRFLSSDDVLYDDLYSFCNAVFWPGGNWEDFNLEQMRATMLEFEERAGFLIDRIKKDTDAAASVFGIQKLFKRSG